MKASELDGNICGRLDDLNVISDEPDFPRREEVGLGRFISCGCCKMRKLERKKQSGVKLRKARWNR